MGFLKKDLTLTRFRDYLNKNKVKKSGSVFTTGDIQGYITRGKLPKYLGGNIIETNSKIEGIKLYNLKD